jgi:Gas vesicle synthesis protein GvpL/GvpF
VRGRVEVGVRAVVGEDAPAPAATGREWLLGRLETSRRDQGVASELHTTLAALAAAERRSESAAPGEILRAAYLVDRDSLARFGATVERLQRERPEVAILCTGPWPPYSFVTAPEPEVVTP